MNTTLGTGDEPLARASSTGAPSPIAAPTWTSRRLMKRACPHLGDAEAAAYAAPFPDAAYKAGVRAFPNLVPDRPDAPGAALSRQARDFWRNALDRQEPDGDRHEGPRARPAGDAGAARAPSATVHRRSRSPKAGISCRNGVRLLLVSRAIHSRRRRPESADVTFSVNAAFRPPLALDRPRRGRACSSFC